MGLGWWMSYRAVDAKRLEAVAQAGRQRAKLTEVKQWIDRVRNTRDRGVRSLLFFESKHDWSVLDEPLVEP
jgi:hypothetical protein